MTQLECNVQIPDGFEPGLMDDPLDQMIDEKGVADILCMPVRTLQDWRARRYGPQFYKLGKSVRYNLFEVREWVAEYGKRSTWE